MAANALCISGDSHVVEPGEVFRPLEKRFGDRAPRMIDTPERKDVLDFRNGNFGFDVGLSLVAGRDPGDPVVKEQAKRGFEIARPGVLDPRERVKDQAIDGIQAEVLYPTVLFRVYSGLANDLELMQATIGCYNDWLHDYCATTPGRLFSLALIQLHDLDEAIAEMERNRKRGAVGVCIPCTAPPERPYSDPYYDRFWAAAEASNTPLTMHVFTSATANHGLPDWGRTQNRTFAYVGIARTIMDLIEGGVCERFPNLKFVPTEFETGWVAHFLQRWDFACHRQGAESFPHMKMGLTEYWARNFRITFEDDEIGIRTRDVIGVDNLIWGSDYPHGDSVFPNSQEVLNRIFTGVAPEERYAITAKNVCELYSLPFEY